MLLLSLIYTIEHTLSLQILGWNNVTKLSVGLLFQASCFLKHRSSGQTEKMGKKKGVSETPNEVSDGRPRREVSFPAVVELDFMQL